MKFDDTFHSVHLSTGTKGKYVPVAETVKGFKEIIEGKHDDLPEAAFYMVGTIEEAQERAEKIVAESKLRLLTYGKIIPGSGDTRRSPGKSGSGFGGCTGD